MDVVERDHQGAETVEDGIENVPSQSGRMDL
jgi:hypothetical protein